MHEGSYLRSGGKMAKMRSPNYPAVSLREAIELVRQLWNKEKKTPVPGDVAVKAMGYTGLNGPARTKLSALKKYGLIEDAGGKIVISDLAMKILQYQVGSKEYKSAISKALVNPDIFSQLYEKYASASDEALRSMLVVEMNFSESGAINFISSFRDNIELARLNGISYSSSIETEQENDDKIITEPVVSKQSKKVPMDQNIEGMRQDVFSFKEGTAVLQWPENLSEDSASDLEDWLNLIIKKAKRAAGIVGKKKPEDQKSAMNSSSE